MQELIPIRMGLIPRGQLEEMSDSPIWGNFISIPLFFFQPNTRKEYDSNSPFPILIPFTNQIALKAVNDQDTAPKQQKHPISLQERYCRKTKC